MHPESNGGGGDEAAAEQRLARALAAQRGRLLRRHAHRLDRADLEECLAQAALELVSRARREADGTVWRPALDLEQRFLSRVTDRRRALAGRSPRQRLLSTAATIGDANLDEVLQVA